MSKQSKITSLDKSTLLNLIAASASVSDVLRGLGLRETGNNRTTLKNKVELEGLQLVFKNKVKREKHTLDEILVKDSKYRNKSEIKRRLLQAGILKNKCSKCGLENIWNHKPIVMQLEHINGDNTDYRRANLTMLCPNCHSQTETFTGRKTRKNYKKCTFCSKPLERRNSSGRCFDCLRK